jgi:hypothetical protein
VVVAVQEVIGHLMAAGAADQAQVVLVLSLLDIPVGKKQQAEQLLL